MSMAKKCDSTSHETISDLLAARCAASPEATAFFTLDHNKSWQAVSWEQFAKNVSRVSVALIAAGVRKGDRVGILAPTSLNWEYAQMGAFAAGAIVAGIDYNNPSEQLNSIINILDLSVLFVQDQGTLAKIPIELCAKIKLIVLLEDNAQHVYECSMPEILAVEEVVEVWNSAGPEAHDAALIVFTSGTTDFSKAIVYTHKQVLIAVDTILGVFDDIETGVILLCWLPLANLFQRIINFCAISKGASNYILNDPRDLMNYLDNVSPQILIGVPKIYERIHAGVIDRIDKEMWLTRKLIRWALRIGHKQSHMKLSLLEPSLTDTILWYFADKTILWRLRRIFGSRIRYLISGSAAMPLWLLEWFESIGLPVLEAYGISENIVPNAINRLSARKLGTVGKPLIPNDITLASDKEILIRGPGVFNGYWRNIPDAGYKDRFTADGYWCTGDLGFFDDEGFLSLTGRKTEAFKTSGGKWVMPAQMEAKLRYITYVEEGIVFPLACGKVAAILSVSKLKCPIKNSSMLENKALAKDDFQDINVEQLRVDLETALHTFPVYQRPIGIIVTVKQFSILSGEMTANLKLRRKTVIDNFASYINELEDEVVSFPKHNQSVHASAAIKPIIIFI